MCEGTNEKALIELLLKHNKLIFSLDDLINLEIFHARQFVPYIISQTNSYYGKIKVIRIGDKQTDLLRIPQELAHKIKKEDIIKCRTSFELEILLIINEGLYKEFLKQKSKISAKEFAKKYIKYNKKYYDGTSQFWLNYHSKRNIFSRFTKKAINQSFLNSLLLFFLTFWTKISTSSSNFNILYFHSTNETCLSFSFMNF